MTAIQELPVPKDYGLGFSYLSWSAGTSVTLANVPWNSDYRDIVRFTNQAALNTYLSENSGPTIEITNMSYAKFGKPIRLATPFHTVQNFNYIRVTNSATPVGDSARSYYYFIVGVEFVNPNVTEIYVQLDVWQTFGYGITFGNCYIEQGHIGIANVNNFVSYGRDYLTVPEGLDIGSEYQIAFQYALSVASARVESLGMPDYSILVATTVALNEDYGSVESPKLASARGSEMENLPNGCELYEFNSLGHFKLFMDYMTDKPWITNGIISINAIPRTARYGMEFDTITVGPDDIPVREISGGQLNSVKTTLREDWRLDIELGRYERLNKFKVFPYTVIEMTSYTGTPLILKPECWDSPDASIVELPHFAPPNPRLAFYPWRYNAKPGTAVFEDAYGVFNDGGEFLNMQTGIMNFPAFSIVNSGYLQFMASNANSIAYQHSSADWSQQRALQGNEVSASQATAGIAASQAQNRITNSHATMANSIANTAAGYQAIQSGIGAVGQIGNGPGGIISAATGAANAGLGYALTTGQNNANNANNMWMANSSNANSNDLAGFNRDTNKDYGDWASKGDYQNQIAGINAKVQDAKLTQPTTAGQIGGDAFNLANYRWGVDLKVKTLSAAAMHSIGEYWLRYGYAINRFGQIPSNFQVMEKFTYWKLKETYITESSCPESFKQVIRGIFEKGVTVWSNPAYIGTIDIADNAPLEGITL